MNDFEKRKEMLVKKTQEERKNENEIVDFFLLLNLHFVNVERYERGKCTRGF